MVAVVGSAAMAASPEIDPATEVQDTSEQAFTSALRQSIGAPARADIDDQATVRLADGLLIVPKEPAARLLTALGKPVPPEFKAMLLGPDGAEEAGIIRLVPVGSIDADAALGWTPDDLLSSLRDTVERHNAVRTQENLEEREVRRWVVPPRYNPELHQLSWAALILPKSAPRESDGEITYHAIGFGREGYVHLTINTSLQRAEAVSRMADNFLAGLNFRPGKAYGDATPADRRTAGGLAGVMELDSLHKAQTGSSVLASDTMVPMVGGIVAAIGALSLFLYIQRQIQRDARRR